MGCGCQKKGMMTNVQYQAQSSEDFKQAFQSESKKSARLAAERNDLQTRIISMERVGAETVRTMESYLGQYDRYLKLALEHMKKSPSLRAEFLGLYGPPPSTMRVK